VVKNEVNKKPMVIHTCSTCGFSEAFTPVGIPQFPVEG
jgi:hypothetical protein